MQRGGKGDREGGLCRRDGVRLVVHHTDSAFPLSRPRKKKSGQKGGRARRKEGERGRSRRRVKDGLCMDAWGARGWEAQAHSFSARSGTRSAPAEKECERVGGSPRGNRKAWIGILGLRMVCIFVQSCRSGLEWCGLGGGYTLSERRTARTTRPKEMQPRRPQGQDWEET